MTRPLDQITAHLHTVRDALRNARTPEDRDRALKRIDSLLDERNQAKGKS